VKLAKHYKDFDYATAQYRAGTKSIQEIADEIGVPRAALFDHLSRNGVTADLAVAIRTKTDELLAGDVVDANGRLPTKQEDIIAINATLQASLIRNHRTDIDRFRRLAMSLLSELEGITAYQDVMEDLGGLMREEGSSGKLKEAYDRVISLPGRTDTLKKLGDTLKVLILLERQAFGMRDDYEDGARTTESQEPTSNFDSITKRFMKVLGQEVTDVQTSD
jgi:hypothetical protein